MLSGVDHVKIWVLEEKGKDKYEITLDKESKYLKQRWLDPNDPQQVESFLELPAEFFSDFVKAVMDYATENNIKTENENLLMGKFEATKEHLADMRKIVFKDFVNKFNPETK